jgi:allophanate hydrolase subunit 2
VESRKARIRREQQLERRLHQELPSEGTCSGSIQVPASGQPVLFLHDHPLTGGYPVIAAVAEYHLDLAGQIPPGAFIRFNIIQPFTELTGSEASDPRAA